MARPKKSESERKPEQPRDALTTKFLELVDYLGERKGKAHGWKSAVATELGIHPVHLSRLMNDSSRSITRGTALEAAELIRLNPKYFDENWKDGPPAAFMQARSTTTKGTTIQDLAVIVACLYERGVNGSMMTIYEPTEAEIRRLADAVLALDIVTIASDVARSGSRRDGLALVSAIRADLHALLRPITESDVQVGKDLGLSEAEIQLCVQCGVRPVDFYARRAAET